MCNPRLHVKRMVVGHTVMENRKINRLCQDKLFCIDVGMSYAMFSRKRDAYLEILHGTMGEKIIVHST